MNSNSWFSYGNVDPYMVVGLATGVTAVVGTTYYLMSKRHVDVGKYAGIGPYAPGEENMFKRVVSRIIVDRTRVDVGRVFYPLNTLLSEQPRRFSDNGHPISGAVRDYARNMINMAIDSVGFSKFEISAAKQSGSGVRSSHQHYAVGDLWKEVSDDKPVKDDVIVGIDIDYYIDDFSEYLGRGVAAIFHTFNPLSVSGKDGDCHYRVKDNHIIYEVPGGGVWHHKVWDWCNFGEFIRNYVPLEGKLERLLGFFGFRKVVYHKVHHARPWKACPDRVLVWLLPQYQHWTHVSLKGQLLGRELNRVDYSSHLRPGWNQVVSTQDGKLCINIGRESEDYSTTLSKLDFDVLMGLGSQQSVSSRLIGMGFKEAKDIALICQYYAGKPAKLDNMTRLGRSVEAKVHWPVSSQADEPETCSRVYANKIVADCNVIPMIKRWETLSESIDMRVTFVANDVKPSNRIMSYAREFLSLVVPDVGVGVPYTLEETRDLLDKPSQTLAVNAIWETMDIPHRRLIECFIKNEPTTKHGRIISSFPDTRFLLGFSAFTLKFREMVLHNERNKHWFIPGRKPLEIAQCVVDYVSSVDEPSEMDFSNMDGTVSIWLQRHLMNGVLHRYFNQRYHDQLLGYTDSLITSPGRAKRFGFRYEPGFGVKSGSPTTCDLNTVLNAFIMYAAIRKTRNDLAKEEAYGLIGMAFGDDGLFEKQYMKSFTQIAEGLGMNVKVEHYVPERGITFLARVYPDPYKTITTFQDPLRTWRKLHMTSRHPDIPLATAALDRVEGYLVTDGLTPITSNFCNMIKRVYSCDPEVESVERRSERKSRNAEKPYWLTEGGSWPQLPEDIDLMLECISKRVGISKEVLRETMRNMDNATDVWTLTELNKDAPDPIKNSVDPEGGMTGGVMDNRINDKLKHATNQRAVGSIRSRLEESSNGSEGGVGNGSADAMPKSERRRSNGAKNFGKVRSNFQSNERGPDAQAQLDHTESSGSGASGTGGLDASGVGNVAGGSAASQQNKVAAKPKKVRPKRDGRGWGKPRS